MYKNWRHKKNEGEKYVEEVEQDLSSFKKLLERENEKVEQIIDGSFWNLYNQDFEKLTDEEIGKKGKDILGIIKPFYREDLLKPYNTESVYINLTTELRSGLTTNDSEYYIEPEHWSNNKTGKVIDCDRKNIWIKEKGDKILVEIERAYPNGNTSSKLSSIFSSLNESDISLRELYEDKVENNLLPSDLEKWARSNDLLEQVLFLYVIKRAQRQDEIAADLLFKTYEKAVEGKAKYWIKGIEYKYGLQFREISELGPENIKKVAKIFLRMLITGDDPEAIFAHIKTLDDSRNIELLFTRSFGKKIKKMVKVIRSRLIIASSEYEALIELEKVFKKEKAGGDLAPLIEAKWLEISALSNPYNWFSARRWFNDKIFDSEKNNNFSNWLLKSSEGKVSALESLLLQWIRSRIFTVKSKIKGEFIQEKQKLSRKQFLEVNEQDDKFKEVSMDLYRISQQDNDDRPTNLLIVEETISAFLSCKRVQKHFSRNFELLKAWINKKSKGQVINYSSMGEEFGLKKRQTIIICKEFENFARKRLRRK